MYASGNKYEGEFLGDLKHGIGKQTFKGVLKIGGIIINSDLL